MPVRIRVDVVASSRRVRVDVRSRERPGARGRGRGWYRWSPSTEEACPGQARKRFLPAGARPPAFELQLSPLIWSQAMREHAFGAGKRGTTTQLPRLALRRV
eukprot:tig00021571_g22377.t1